LREWLNEKIAHAYLRYIWRTQFRRRFSVERMRENFDRLGKSPADDLRIKYPSVQIKAETINGIETESIQSVGRPTRTILFVHGGGFIMGSIDSYRRNALRLAHRTNTRVVIFNYRRAPDFRFPAALDDVLAMVKATAARFPDDELILAGDSAGGGLTLSALMALRDRGAPLPRAALIFSPFADLSLSGDSVKENRFKEASLTPDLLKQCAKWYRGDHDAKDPAVSPVFGDYRGLPPLLVLVGDSEILFDDARRIADRAKEAGVDVTLEVGRRMQHVWFFSLPSLAGSKRAMSTIANFLERL